jgi:hypothetical protein
MTVSRKNNDVAAGLMFVAFGAVGLYFARGYPVGSAVRMGAGYVPNGLSWLMIILGGGIAAKGFLAGGDKLTRWAWRPLFIITASILAFSFLIESAGLAIATLVLVIASAYAGDEFRWKEQAIVGIVLAVGSVLLFAKGLGLPLKILPGA